MALFLYRLGRWCAAHSWRVVAAWVATLVVLGVGAISLGSAPTNQIIIPGTEFQRVYQQLGQSIPAAAGSVGTVVLDSGNGTFSPAQRAAIAETFGSWRAAPHVKAVQDPFANQQRLDRAASELEGADAGLAAGTRQLADAKNKLDQARGQLAFGTKAAEDLARTSPNSPQLAKLEAQIVQGQRQLAQGEAKYATGKAKLERGVKQVRQGKAQVAMAGGQRFVTKDGRYAVVQVQFDTSVESIPLTDRAKIPEAASPLEQTGVKAEYSKEITENISLVGAGEVIGVTVAVIVLIVMLGTMIAAGLPLLVALFGVGVGLAGAVTASALYELNSLTPALALMLGLAVGIDYSLFIVNRHRGQIIRGMSVVESAGRSTGTAGNAVLFAGSTVVIALAALTISGIPILAQMGLVAAATVVAAVMVALTLTPAVLGLMGTRVVPKRQWRASGYESPGVTATRNRPAKEHDAENGAWYVRLMTARPWLTVLAVVGLVAVTAVPVLQLRLGLPDGSTEARDSTAYRTYDLVDREFGPGLNGPVLAVATLPAGATAEDAASKTADIGTSLSRMHGVEHVLPVGTSADHRTLAFQVVPDSGPAEARTTDTVDSLRRSTDALGLVHRAEIGLTGQTVANIEISERIGNALVPYLAVVVGLSLLILMVVFRSVVVPVLATLGFLLSVAAAFGATVAVYQWGWLGDLLGVSRPGPILSFMPIIVIGVLFGLAMDYQMFLVSGMHEAHAHGEDARSAVRSGFVHGAKVVTAAAIIMFFVFGGFVFSHLTMVRPIGFGLAVGVIIDAVLVRMTLTPALMHILGDKAWWIPGWLERIIPDLDVEGTGLTAHLAGREVSSGAYPQSHEPAPVG